MGGGFTGNAWGTNFTLKVVVALVWQIPILVAIMVDLYQITP